MLISLPFNFPCDSTNVTSTAVYSPIKFDFPWDFIYNIYDQNIMETTVRTHIELNDQLIHEVLTLGKFETKKAAVNAALLEYVKFLKRQKLLKLRGKIQWQGNLEQLRAHRK